MYVAYVTHDAWCVCVCVCVCLFVCECVNVSQPVLLSPRDNNLVFKTQGSACRSRNHNCVVLMK